MNMSTQQMGRMRIILTGLITIAEMGQLAWEYAHGGIQSHHLLNQPNLPAISNVWSALLLPTLTWFLLGRIQARVLSRSEGTGWLLNLPINIVAGFMGSLVYGALLAIAFTAHYEETAFYLLIGLLVAAVLIPVYRAEYVLGFILGMTFTFGAVLPTIVASLVAAISASFHFLVRHAIKFIRDVLTSRRSRGLGENS